MPDRLPISVCFVSGAEAHRIGQAFESVAAWAQEIVIVLNEEVRDGTEELALRYGAKVFREPWKGFIGQKNSAAAKATQPWLLNLDADEVVTPKLAEEIRVVVNSTQPSHAGYEFPRCTFYCGRWIRHGDWYPDRVLRLWQSGKAVWSGEEPHASLEVAGSVGRLKSDLLHYTNESIDRGLAKITSYSSDFVRQQLAKGRKPRFLDLAFRPGWRFFRSYVIRLGFLDGWPGYYIAWMNAFATATRYAKLLEAKQEQSPKKSAPGESPHERLNNQRPPRTPEA